MRCLLIEAAKTWTDAAVEGMDSMSRAALMWETEILGSQKASRVANLMFGEDTTPSQPDALPSVSA